MGNQEGAKKKFYKKWWFWAIIILIIIIAASSNNDKAKKVGENNNGTESKQIPIVDQAFKVGDKVQIGDTIVTVNKVEFSQGGQYNKPANGNEWINLNLTIENTGVTQQYITTLGQMFVRDGENNSYQVSVTDKSLENPGAGLDGQIIANSKRTGWVGFEIKKDSKNLQFQYNASMFSGKNILVNLGR